MKAPVSIAFSTFFACFMITACSASPIHAPNGKAKNKLHFPTNVEIIPDEWDVEEVDVSHIDNTKKLIAFTFDDAPSPYSENLAAVFAAFNEKNPLCKGSATVFYNGYRLDSYPLSTLELAAAVGLELGNHSYRHLNLAPLETDEIRLEIDAVDGILERIDKRKRHLFRPPFGNVSESVREAAYTPIIDWTIDTLDWTGISAEAIYQTVFSQKFSGAIVLMHDGYPNTLTALKKLLPDLRDDGYQVVSVSQMAKAHGCVLKRGGVYIRARKRG